MSKFGYISEDIKRKVFTTGEKLYEHLSDCNTYVGLIDYDFIINGE